MESRCRLTTRLWGEIHQTVLGRNRRRLDQIEPTAVSIEDASTACFDSVAEASANVRSDEGRGLWRVEFRLLDELDPRELLADKAT